MTSIEQVAFSSPFSAEASFLDIPAAMGPLAEAEAANRRAAELNSSLKPIDVFEVQLVDYVAIQTVRIEQVQQQQRELRAQRAGRAARRWDDDRRDEAEALAATLGKAPSLVARQLRRTSQGCDWLIARWMQLATFLAAVGALNATQLRLALDLLGFPAEFRDGPTPFTLDVEGQLALIRAQIDGLEREKAEVLGPIERTERAIAEKGDGPDEDGRLATLYRREQGFSVRLEWAKEQLKKGRHAYSPNDGPGGGGRPVAYAPPAMPPATTPAASPGITYPGEDEWRRVLQARKVVTDSTLGVPQGLRAGGTGSPSGEEPGRGPGRAHEGASLPTATEAAPSEPATAPPPAGRRKEPIRNPPDLLAMPLAGRLRALVAGDASGRPANRRDRRDLKARIRRLG